MKYIMLIVGLLVASGGEGSAIGQKLIRSAWVVDDQLTVKFEQSVDVTNDEGFRLVGGVARISALLTGQSTRLLTFSLTDHVLPDDEFRVLYWSALGDLRQKDSLVSDWAVSVVNQSIHYGGAGTIYYVSTTGRDAYLGTDSVRPLRTVAQAQQLAQPGDYILLRRGDTFLNTSVKMTSSGRAGQYLTFAAYGRGAQPVITHTEEDVVTIADRHYVHVDNWHLQVRGSGEKGVYIMGNCQHPVISNCRVEGIGKPLYGINFGKNDGITKGTVHPKILNNQVSGFMVNIISTGYPYDGTHEIDGGLIENNLSGNTRSIANGDGIDAQRGQFHGLVIRKNEVFGYYDDGIDVFGADSIVIEHNTVHHPQQPSNSGQGIKAGGLTLNEPINGRQSANIIVRYNTVHSLYNNVDDSGSQSGINANDGASGQVYGNLIYDVGGHGIVVSGPIHHWEVHHNIVINAGEAALNVWTQGNDDYRVTIANNVLGGDITDIKVNTRSTGKTIVGEKNQLVHQKTMGKYHGSSDYQANLRAVFHDPRQLNLGVKPAYFHYLNTVPPAKRKQE